MEKSSKDRFTRLMKFLAKYKEIVENRSTDVKISIGKTFTSFVSGMTFTAKANLGGGRNEQDKKTKVPEESETSDHAWLVMMEIPIWNLLFICWLTVMYEKA